jgi:hypothetical protein
MSEEAWKLIDHLSTVIIALATIVGFVTLWFSQRALHADNARLKKITAIELNERFAGVVLVEYSRLHEAYWKQRIEHLDSPRSDSPLVLTRGLRKAALIHGNALESFALYVENGLVDEDLLFRAAGKPYCEQVKNLATLCGIDTDQAIAGWQVVYDLHMKWSSRLKSQPTPFVPKPIESDSPKTLADLADPYSDP